MTDSSRDAQGRFLPLRPTVEALQDRVTKLEGYVIRLFCIAGALSTLVGVLAGFVISRICR